MTKYTIKFLAVTAALMLVACSGKNETASTASAPPVAAAAATTPAKPAPVAVPAVMMEVKQSNMAAIPADIADKLKAIGSKNDIAGTAALYTPSFPEGYLAKLKVTRDVAYGPAERNILDVMAPAGASQRPVIVFVHGGGFGAGNKSAANTPFYDNIPYWVASKGLVGVNINYRYAPASKWPAGIEDMNNLMTWLKANIAQYGGDPNQIFFWGKSTGSSHIADYLADRVKQGKGSDIKGAIFTSGSFALGDTPLWSNYYGDDVSKYPEMNSLPNLVKTDAPLMATYAEFDGDQYKQQFALLANALTAAGKSMDTLYLQNHSHMSETYAVGTVDDSLTGPVLDFVMRHSGK